MSGETLIKFFDDAYICQYFSALDIFSLNMKIEIYVSSKYIPKCFCQLAQKTGALLKNIFV